MKNKKLILTSTDSFLSAGFELIIANEYSVDECSLNIEIDTNRKDGMKAFDWINGVLLMYNPKQRWKLTIESFEVEEESE